MTDRSVYAINSGPASAPQAGQYVCSPFKKKNVITVDMGGTSFDITLTKEGLTNLNKNIDFLRYRIGVPMIQVETLGAGGGSIGWIDSLGILQVGPQSAGSQPGPACYGQGGEEPTTSDANLVLGYLNPEGLLGGTLPLSVDKARAAIEEDRRPARPHDRAGRLRHVHDSQQQHGERHTPRVGRARLRSARLRACRRRRSDRRPHLRARPRDRHRDDHIAQTRLGALRFRPDHLGRQIQLHGASPARLDNSEAYRRLNTLFEEIEAKGVQHLIDDGFAKSNIAVKRSLEMRYVGQVHECTVDIDTFEIDDQNDRAHQTGVPSPPRRALHLFRAPLLVEVVNIEATLYGLIDKPKLPALKKGVAPERAIKDHRKSIFSAYGKGVRTPVYDGGATRRWRKYCWPRHHRGDHDDHRHRARLDREAARERIVCDQERRFAASGESDPRPARQRHEKRGTMKRKRKSKHDTMIFAASGARLGMDLATAEGRRNA